MKDQFGISKRLKELRGPISQKMLAEKIGVSLRAYQWYESGKRIPPSEVLVKIASVHQVPVDYLAKGDFCFVDFYYEGKSNKKKLKNRREAELLTATLLPYVERFPRMFDQFKRILTDTDWKKREALRALLRSMDPNCNKIRVEDS